MRQARRLDDDQSTAAREGGDTKSPPVFVGAIAGLALALSIAWPGTAASPAPTPASSVPAELMSVSCPSAASCMAVGVSGQTTSQGLAEQWNGTRWSVLPTPPTGVTNAYLYGVSCSSPKACTAVGFTSTGIPAQNSSPLAERWNGTRWSIQTVPMPSGTNVTSDLYSVSCPSAAMCAAVGIYTVNDAGTGSLLELWNGSSWSLQAPPPYPSPELLSVSCVSPNECVADGQFGGQSAAIRWNGSTWTSMHPPNPTAPESSDGLVGMGCTASPQFECQAVGWEGSGDFSQSTFGLGWVPGHWTLEYTPSPGNRAWLSAVSCASNSACVAVGWHPVPTVGRLPLLGFWDGTEWRTQSPPLVRGSMDGVSCASSVSCTAVGTRPTGAALIEHWNGSTWTVQPSPNPPA